jgi:hypothetical protein
MCAYHMQKGREKVTIATTNDDGFENVDKKMLQQ